MLISSKKIVPLFAISNFPMLLLFAPVNAPFSYPKSSLSSSVSGKDEQSTFIKALSALWLFEWIYFAKTSFPVPVSPSIRIVTDELAAIELFSFISCIFKDSPKKFASFFEFAIAISL